MSNADINFQVRNLQWRSYSIENVLPTTGRVKLIRKKEFAATTLNPEYEAFIIYITALNISFDLGNEVHLSKKAQIAYLKADKTLTEVPSKYADFVDVFLPKLATKLRKYTKISDHTIELVDNQQPPYGPIYSLDPIELKILKIYIDNNLANGFIKSSKSSISALIFFDKKLNKSLRLYVDYQSLNNLITKNRYLLLLVGKLLD